MKKNYGFTLIEVAIVLLIVAFTLGSILLPLGTKLEEKAIGEAQVQLSDIKQALINFTIANSRMPCPDTNDDGIEDTIANTCAQASGELPFVSLSTPHRQDPWGQDFIYRVTLEFADTVNGTTCNVSPRPGVSIEFCSSADGNINISDFDLSTMSLTPAANGVAAVVLSMGRNTGVNSQTQTENTDGDNQFVKMGYGGVDSAMPFNDIVIWISASEIVGELIRAQVLP